MRFDTEDSRWAAAQARDPAADGKFVIAVRTTGIYCRPVCRVRPPLRKNVTFYNTPAEAVAAGFRACKRCYALPKGTPESIRAAIRAIETAAEPPSLAELADAVGLSEFHFHKQFKRYTGVTPKAYLAAKRQERLRANLRTGQTVTESLYAAGFGASSRMYEESGETLGMTPSAFRKGGAGETIRYATADCALGRVLVGGTARGVCLIAFADTDAELLTAARERFPHADLRPADASFTETVAAVVALADGHSAPDLPLDVRGTAFQRRVWEELRAIPPGTTITYAELAKRIGKPKAVRAVGAACGENPAAVLVPCHRVVGTDGKLHGYRWGLKRKKMLIEREAEVKVGK